MQKDQKIINEVKSSILEGYNVIPVSIKIKYSLDQISLMNIYMKGFYEYLSKREEIDRESINKNGTYSYYPEYIGNEYNYIIDGYFNNIMGIEEILID